MPTRTGVPAASFLPSRLTRMTHADVPDGSPDPGRARPTRSFAAPTAHGRAHLSDLYQTRSSDSRRSARRAPYRISAPHRPLSACAAQACSSSGRLAWSGRVQAALARRMVPRGAGTTPVQREAPVYGPYATLEARPHTMRHLAFRCYTPHCYLDVNADSSYLHKMQMQDSSLHRASKIPKDATFWPLHCPVSR